METVLISEKSWCTDEDSVPKMPVVGAKPRQEAQQKPFHHM